MSIDPSPNQLTSSSGRAAYFWQPDSLALAQPPPDAAAGATLTVAGATFDANIELDRKRCRER